MPLMISEETDEIVSVSTKELDDDGGSLSKNHKAITGKDIQWNDSNMRVFMIKTSLIHGIDYRDASPFNRTATQSY